MKKQLITIAALGLLGTPAAGITAAGAEDTSTFAENISVLNRIISTLQTQKEALQEQIAAKYARIAELEAPDDNGRRRKNQSFDVKRRQCTERMGDLSKNRRRKQQRIRNTGKHNNASHHRNNGRQQNIGRKI